MISIKILHLATFYVTYLVSYGYQLHETMPSTEDTNSCNLIHVTSTGPAGTLQWDLMGYYTRKSSILNGKQIYQHKDFKLFLYYLEEGGGYWIIGEDIGEDIGGIQNGLCDDVSVPTDINCRNGWMYGDGNSTWQEDITIRVECKFQYNELCLLADCSKPSVNVLCAEYCYVNYMNSPSLYLNIVGPEVENESTDKDFERQHFCESRQSHWKYFEDTPIFFITTSIVVLATISFQSGGIIIALALKYFENKESYKLSKFKRNIVQRSKKSPAQQWKVLKMLQKDRSQYLKQKYWNKWKYVKNEECIWMRNVSE